MTGLEVNPAAPDQAARRPRLVLWVSLGMAVAIAVLVAVLATSGPASQQSADSPLIALPQAAYWTLVRWILTLTAR